MSMSESTPSKPGLWQKAEIIGKLLGATLIPISIGVASIIYSVSQQNREVEAKLFELSVEILKDPPGNPRAREWAAEQFERVTGLKIDPFTLEGRWSGIAHDNDGIPRFRYQWEFKQKGADIQGTIEVNGQTAIWVGATTDGMYSIADQGY